MQSFLSVDQLKIHFINKRSIVSVSKNWFVVHGVVVDELDVAHAGGPVNILQSPFYSEKIKLWLLKGLYIKKKRSQFPIEPY